MQIYITPDHCRFTRLPHLKRHLIYVWSRFKSILVQVLILPQSRYSSSLPWQKSHMNKLWCEVHVLKFWDTLHVVSHVFHLSCTSFHCHWFFMGVIYFHLWFFKFDLFISTGFFTHFHKTVFPHVGHMVLFSHVIPSMSHLFSCSFLILCSFIFEM